MIPERIQEMLASQDVEMVQLGVAWISHNIPQESWEKVMGDYNNCQYFTSFYEEKFFRTLKPWKWRIEDNQIIVEKVDQVGLWENLRNPTRHTYTLYTGEGGVKLIEEALKQYNNDKTGKGKETGNG